MASLKDEWLSRVALATAKRIEAVLRRSVAGADAATATVKIAALIEPALFCVRRRSQEQAARLAEENRECAWCNSRHEIADAIRARKQETKARSRS